MSTGAVYGGSTLPIEVLRMINELGRELHDASQQGARDAAQLALEKGYEEANQLHEAAADIRTGAIVGLATTAAGAAIQAYGAYQLGNVEAGPREISRAESFITIGSSTSQMGGYANDLSQAAAKDHEAYARRAAAEAQAANQLAQSEQTEAAEAQKVIDRARQGYGDLIASEHASMMAAIGRA